jgi:hypothetical protein
VARKETARGAVPLVGVAVAVAEGASLTAVTVSATEAGVLSSAPSLTWKVKLSAP